MLKEWLSVIFLFHFISIYWDPYKRLTKFIHLNEVKLLRFLYFHMVTSLLKQIFELKLETLLSDANHLERLMKEYYFCTKISISFPCNRDQNPKKMCRTRFIRQWPCSHSASYCFSIMNAWVLRLLCQNSLLISIILL